VEREGVLSIVPRRKRALVREEVSWGSPGNARRAEETKAPEKKVKGSGGKIANAKCVRGREDRKGETG